MKYLKKFNESSDGGFKLASRAVGDRFTISKVVEFDQNDLDKIKSLLSKWGVNIDLVGNKITFWMPYKDIKSTRKYIKIESYQDEWFLLSDYPMYYECDQIEGVINCLKTLLPKEA